ncbi:glycosyltransferase [bacterium]|nr:glycosyltransferase [bacterium]
MKIVLPVHHFPPRYSSGAELYTYRLARTLRRRGHDAQVVTIEAIDEGTPNQLTVVQDDYDGIPVWRLSFDIFHSPQRRLWDYDNDLIEDWFQRFLTKEQPDLLHLQTGYLMSVAPVHAAVTAGVPMVLTLHDYWYLCPRHTLQRGDGTLCTEIPTNPAGCAWCRKLEEPRFRLADKLSAGFVGQAAQWIGLQQETAVVADRRRRLHEALGNIDAVIAPSQFMADQFAPYVQAEQLHIVRLGVEPSEPVEVTSTDKDGTLHIGYTGQIAPHKGVHLLIEAFRALKNHTRNAELHIYGGLDAYPDYVAGLRKLAHGDPRVHFHGRFTAAQLGQVLAGLHVVVVPSTWYENSPMVIMEAHAAGKPVITAALGGMAELVRHEIDGLHFRANNARDLGHQLQRLVDSPSLVTELAQGIVASRTPEDEFNQIVQIYQTAVDGHPQKNRVTQYAI